MIPKPIQITNIAKPKMVTFEQFQKIFKTHTRWAVFDYLTIEFDADYKLLRATGHRDQDTGFPDLTFLFPRSSTFLNRIIKVFRSRYADTRVSVPLDLLDSYSLIPRRSKVKRLKSKPISFQWHSVTKDVSLAQLVLERTKLLGWYSLDQIGIIPSKDGLLWTLYFGHHIHDDDYDVIKLQTDASKKWIEAVLKALEKDWPARCRIRLSCFSKFKIRKGAKPKPAKLYAPSADDIPF